MKGRFHGSVRRASSTLDAGYSEDELTGRHDTWSPRQQGLSEESGKMESMCLDFEFIQNCGIVANVCAELRSLGFVVVCTGCDDLEAVFIAFLVSEAKKEAWP